MGDVKYKLWTGEWPRGDLYQLTVFGAAYRATEALEIGFSATEAGPQQVVEVGDLRLTYVVWPADRSLSPLDASDQLCEMVGAWLGSDAMSSPVAA